MIKVGNRVKIVSVHERDAYFRDGLAESRGVVQSVDMVYNIKGTNYYAGYVLITDLSDECPVPAYKTTLDEPFYFAYAQLRKVKK